MAQSLTQPPASVKAYFFFLGTHSDGLSGSRFCFVGQGFGLLLRSGDSKARDTEFIHWVVGMVQPCPAPVQ